MLCYKDWLIRESAIKLNYVKKWVVGSKILDIGCGRGYYSRYLSERGYNVIALDVVRLTTYKEFVYGSVEKLPFRNASFNTTIAFDVLEHVDDDTTALREILRITQNRILISVPNSDDYLLTKYNLTFKHQKDKEHRRSYTVEEIVDVICSHKFVIRSTSIENKITPMLVTEFLRPKSMRKFYRAVVYGLQKLKFLSPLTGADIFIVADKSQSS